MATRPEAEPAITEASWRAALDAITAADEVVLACHVDPDGDALGSMLALTLALRALGKRALAVFPGNGARNADDPAPPATFGFLPGADTLAVATALPQRPAVLVTLDCASAERLGELEPLADAAATVVVVDHHARGTAFGDVRLLDGSAAATAVIVAELIDRLGVPYDRAIATNLYVGLVTDTGRFRYASTTPEVLELAARLMRHGVDQADVNRRIWDTRSFGYLKLLGRALERTRVEPEAGLAWTAVPLREVGDLGVRPDEPEGVIDAVRALEDVDCAMVCREQADGRWKVSLRSKGATDVGLVAARLGGGGHPYAAGFTAGADLDAVVSDVVRALRAVRSSAADPGPGGADAPRAEAG